MSMNEPKKTYVAPTLRVEGTVEKLTASFGLSGSDAIGGAGTDQTIT